MQDSQMRYYETNKKDTKATHQDSIYYCHTHKNTKILRQKYYQKYVKYD